MPPHAQVHFVTRVTRRPSFVGFSENSACNNVKRWHAPTHWGHGRPQTPIGDWHLATGISAPAPAVGGRRWTLAIATQHWRAAMGDQRLRTGCCKTPGNYRGGSMWGSAGVLVDGRRSSTLGQGIHTPAPLRPRAVRAPHRFLRGRFSRISPALRIPQRSRSLTAAVHPGCEAASESFTFSHRGVR